jgi:hypothetical protein
MDFELATAFRALSRGIDRRKRDTATFHAFIRLRAEVRRTAAPLSEMATQETQPIPRVCLDASGEP